MFFYEIYQCCKYKKYQTRLEQNENLRVNNNRIISEGNNILIDDERNREEINRRDVAYQHLPPIDGEEMIIEENSQHRDNILKDLESPPELLNTEKVNKNKQLHLNKNFIDFEEDNSEKKKKRLKDILKSKKKKLFEEKNFEIENRLGSLKKIQEMEVQKNENKNDSSVIQKDDSWDLKDVDYTLIDINNDLKHLAEKVLDSNFYDKNN
jgi:hypothetical protein